MLKISWKTLFNSNSDTEVMQIAILKVPIADSDQVRTGWWIDFRNISPRSKRREKWWFWLSKADNSSEFSESSDFSDSTASFETSEEN